MKCPTCKKESVEQYKPFCCKRCAEIDLARWLRGDYRIEGDEKDGQETAKDEDRDN